MKRGLAILLATITCSGILFASGSSETKNSEDTISNKYDVENRTFHDVTLKVTTRYGSSEPSDIYYQKKIKEFSDADNGITIVSNDITTESDYLDNLRTKFATGDTPNVFLEYGGARCLDYLEANALLNMKPYFEQYPDWYNNFSQSVWDKAEYDGYDGIWGVPIKSYLVTLYCNTELFDQAGLELPETFDDLLHCCKVFKEKGILPFQTGEKDVWRLGHFSNNLITQVSQKKFGSNLRFLTNS